MRKFIGFLYEYRDYFALVFAVIFSLYFLFSNESREIQILRGKANNLFSVLSRPVIWVKGINELRTENELLREKTMQLALLNSSLLNHKHENELLRNMLNYKRTSQLELVPARVMSMGISPLVSSITIDVGTDQGIEENSAVLTIYGIVGKTVSVGKKASTVQIMKDYNFRVSVKLEDSGNRGILRWKEGNEFEVWEIPKTVNIRIGERIITSGFSDIFPENLPVGEVTGISDLQEMLQQIVLARAYTKFILLEHVFVVKKAKS